MVAHWIAECRLSIDQARLLTLHTASKIDTLGNRKARKQVTCVRALGQGTGNTIPVHSPRSDKLDRLAKGYPAKHRAQLPPENSAKVSFLLSGDCKGS